MRVVTTILLFTLTAAIATSTVTMTADTVTVNDTIIFREMYFHNGVEWNKFELDTATSWRVGGVTVDQPDNAEKFAYYSCSWNNGWQCSDDWKIRDLDTAEENTTADITVPTVQDALNLTNVSIGTTIKARGRDEPGDGGGGLFNVTNSGCETDGATCFIFDQDMSRVSETIDDSLDSFSLSNGNISWRSINISYGNGVTSGVKHFHGVKPHWGSWGPNIDLSAGRLGNPTLTWVEKNRADGDGSITVNYSFTYSAKRLEREGVHDSVNLAWWDAPAANPDNPKEATPYLMWAMNRAANLSDEEQWGFVDIPREYYILHEVDIPSGVKLRGVGDVNKDGFTRGTLTWMPGEMVYHLNDSYDRAEDPDFDRAVGGLAGRTKTLITPARGAESVGLQDLELDGNVDENMHVFEDVGGWEYDGVQRWLQDSGDWNGFYTGNPNAFPDGMLIDIQNVHVKDMGSNGLAGTWTDGHVPNWNLTNVTVDTALRNHLLYGLIGKMKNVKLQGEFWGGNPIGWRTAEYENITVENIRQGRFGYNTLLASRSSKLDIDGFTIDLRNSTRRTGNQLNIFRLDGVGQEISDGTVHGFSPDDYNASNPPQFLGYGFWNTVSEVPLTTVSNVTIIDHGQSMLLMQKGGTRFGLRFEDITYKPAEGVTNSTFELGKIGLPWGSSDWPPRAGRLFFKNFTVKSDAHNFPGRFGAPEGRMTGLPIDMYFSSGLVQNRFGPWYTFVEGAGGVAYEDFQRGLRVYFNDFTLRSDNDKWWHQRLSPGNPPKFRNVSTFSGRVSDDQGRYTSDASDQGNDYVLIETNLLSRPWERSATVTSGDYTVEQVNVANSDGSIRADDNEGQEDPYLKVILNDTITADEQVTVDWTARVTPLEDYRTEGLFVAREVPPQNLTSQDTKTIDLRGVASSQESRKKITYTATSANPDVVTAAVKEDDYTLELERQGSGTTNVTVTGRIDGVGETTETFTVTT